MLKETVVLPNLVNMQFAKTIENNGIIRIENSGIIRICFTAIAPLPGTKAFFSYLPLAVLALQKVWGASSSNVIMVITSLSLALSISTFRDFGNH